MRWKIPVCLDDDPRLVFQTESDGGLSARARHLYNGARKGPRLIECLLSNHHGNTVGIDRVPAQPGADIIANRGCDLVPTWIEQNPYIRRQSSTGHDANHFEHAGCHCAQRKHDLYRRRRREVHTRQVFEQVQIRPGLVRSKELFLLAFGLVGPGNVLDRERRVVMALLRPSTSNPVVQSKIAPVVGDVQVAPVPEV